MKLADALSLRKQLNASLAATTPMTANALLTQEHRVILPVGRPIDPELAKVKYRTALSMIDKFRYFNEALTDLDEAIQATNSTQSASLPSWVFENKYTTARVMMTFTMTKMLLRRKELGGLVKLLTTYHEKAMKAPLISRKPLTPTVQEMRQMSAGGMEMQTSDEWTIQDNAFNAEELARQLSFFCDCRREVDSAIQQINWSTEVTVSNAIKAIYIPRPPEYVVAKPIEGVVLPDNLPEASSIPPLVPGEA
jgi:hypothetical protein